jgi:phosphoglycerate dehydrogenase-like enzyme
MNAAAGVDRRRLSVVIGFVLEPKYIEHLEINFPEASFRLSNSKAELMEMVGDADALFGWPSDAVIAAGKKLRWMHILGAGADGFTKAPVAERGIVVTNGRGIAASNIAEHVLSLMFSFARALPALARAQREQEWTKSQQLRLFELSGQTVGIIGLGAIGQSLASKAGALGMKVLGARRSQGAVPGVDQMFQTDQLPELGAKVDHLVACVPGTPDSIGLLDARVFSAMRRGSYFYNVGRGNTVVTEDLLQALAQGTIAGAGLDVVDPEPLPKGHPLWHHPNVIMTSHTAGNTAQYWDRGIVLFERNLRAFMAGVPLTNTVDFARGY